MSILKRFISMLTSALLIITVLLGALMLFQDRLLYYPARVALEHYAPDGLELWPLRETSLDSDTSATLSPGKHQDVLGLISHPETEQNTGGLAIVFHGNAGHAGHRSYYAQQLNALGVRTILAEYPGYGPRSGTPSEDVLIRDGIDIVKQAHQQFGGPIWLIGESLGAGVAAGVIKEVHSIVRGIVLITPWNRLVDVAKYHYPFLPVRWLLKSEYDSISALNAFAGPKLIIVAQNDRVVPAKYGVDLFNRIDQPKRLVRVDNVGHNDWISGVEPDFWERTMNWLITSSSQ